MGAIDLLGDLVLDVPKTEGIKYAGSKQKLLPQILLLANKIKPKTVLDGFAGTTRVSQALAQSGYTVYANDISVWSEIFASCYLLNKLPKNHYQAIVDHLNNLQGIEGWFSQYYGGDSERVSSIGSDGLKKPWQRHNTQKLDAIRLEIDALGLSEIEKSVVLTSLIRALDEVDNTLGHYASYLNIWSQRSFKTLTLKVPSLFPNSGQHLVFQKDIFDLLPEIEVDLAYFDPPYGSNNEKMPPSRVRYSAYYHIWSSVILNDHPAVFGKASRRADTSDKISASVFEEFRHNESGQLLAVEAIRKTLQNTRAKYVMLSYSSGGRATAAQLHDVISQNGRLIEVLELDYKKNVMANMRWTHEWIREAEEPNKEFLFLIDKT